MGTRGRTSAEAEKIITLQPEDMAQHYPTPPDELSKEESDIWVDVCRKRAIGTFAGDEERRRLKDYCSAQANVDRINAAMRDCQDLTDDAILRRFERLQKNREREVRLLISLARKLGLMDDGNAAPAALHIKPDDEEPESDEPAPWDA